MKRASCDWLGDLPVCGLIPRRMYRPKLGHVTVRGAALPDDGPLVKANGE